MTTEQEKFWQSDFGDEYSKRSNVSAEELDRIYKKRFGFSQSEMNREFLSNRDISTILEVGSNIGNQLLILTKGGYTNLTGIEINRDAVQEAKKRLPQAIIHEGSALSLPFPDNSFDLVFTAGVLIHINPDDLPKVMGEIHRVSKHFIWGFEYFSDTHKEIEYRGNKNRLWKANFAKLYRNLFPDLVLAKEKKYKYSTDNNIDSMFLLEKK